MTGDADRTGDPVVDQQIDTFIAEQADVPWIRQVRCGVPGRCDEINSLFLVGYLARAGISSRLAAIGPGLSSFERYGYQDRGPGLADHALVVVDAANGTFTVDFAATQYGYVPWPLVRTL